MLLSKSAEHFLSNFIYHQVCRDFAAENDSAVNLCTYHKIFGTGYLWFEVYESYYDKNGLSLTEKTQVPCLHLVKIKFSDDGYKIKEILTEP